MSITVILRLDVTEGKEKEFLQILSQYLADTKAYEGFIDISIYSEMDTSNIVFISRWQSLDVYKRYLKWRTDTGVMSLLGKLLESPPIFSFLDKAIDDECQLISYS